MKSQNASAVDYRKSNSKGGVTSSIACGIVLILSASTVIRIAIPDRYASRILTSCDIHIRYGPGPRW